MSELTGLNSLLFQLKEYGFHNAAIATAYDGNTEYLAWYKMDVFVDNPQRLRHLGALARQMYDNDTELPKA